MTVRFILTIVDDGTTGDDAMIRNRHNQIPYPAEDTKRERNTNNLDGIKFKTTRTKGQDDNSFPADDNWAILNKPRKNHRQTACGRTMAIRINHNRSTALERSVFN